MGCHFYSLLQRLRRLRQTCIFVRYGGLFGALALIIVAVAFSDVDTSFVPDPDDPAIEYSSRPTTDAVAILNREIKAGKVTKLRPSDGVILATYPVPDPYVLAYDGANLWSTDCNGHNVTKIRPTDGRILGSFPVGSCNTALVFDGANIWVGAHNIVKLRASDGANLGSFDVGNTDQNPSQGIAFDGTNIWAANSGTNGAPGNTVTKLNSNGQVLGTFVVGSAPEAMAFDGAHIWVSNNNSGTVTEIDARSGATLGTFAAGVLPNGIGFDGANIWVANSGSNTVTRLRVSEEGAGPRSQTFAVGTCPINGVAFDGANVWVTNGCSNTISKL